MKAESVVIARVESVSSPERWIRIGLKSLPLERGRLLLQASADFACRVEVAGSNSGTFTKRTWESAALSGLLFALPKCGVDPASGVRLEIVLLEGATGNDATPVAIAASVAVFVLHGEQRGDVMEGWRITETKLQ